MHGGVLMRSRLEAGFAQWMDHWRIPWTYEPHAFSGPHGQWLPDFRIHISFTGDEELREGFVEVKPEPPRRPGGWLGGAMREFDLAQYTELFDRMTDTWDSKPGAVLILAFPAPETDAFARIAVMQPTSDGLARPWIKVLRAPAEPGAAPTIDFWDEGQDRLPRYLGPWYWRWWQRAIGPRSS